LSSKSVDLCRIQSSDERAASFRTWYWNFFGEKFEEALAWVAFTINATSPHKVLLWSAHGEKHPPCRVGAAEGAEEIVI
jgi:hypothetical protein